jgi:hypothetical protein
MASLPNSTGMLPSILRTSGAELVGEWKRSGTEDGLGLELQQGPDRLAVLQLEPATVTNISLSLFC